MAREPVVVVCEGPRAAICVSVQASARGRGAGGATEEEELAFVVEQPLVMAVRAFLLAPLASTFARILHELTKNLPLVGFTFALVGQVRKEPILSIYWYQPFFKIFLMQI